MFQQLEAAEKPSVTVRPESISLRDDVHRATETVSDSSRDTVNSGYVTVHLYALVCFISLKRLYLACRNLLLMSPNISLGEPGL